MKKIIMLMVAGVMVLTACKSGDKEGDGRADTAALLPSTVWTGACDMQVVAMPDCLNEKPVDLFLGSYDDSLLRVLAPDGVTPSAINIYLVSTDDGRNILIDAGLGDDGGSVMAQLNSCGVSPEKVDAVCLTHLHPDHIGGLLHNGQPLFVNAEIYVSVDEFNAWSDGGVLAPQNGQWRQVLSCYANQLRLFGDGDTIAFGHVVAHLAPGHTPGHTVFEAGRLFFVGDLVHAQDLQLSQPDFCAKYDGDYALSVKTRRWWLDFFGDGHQSDYFCGAHCYDPFIQGARLAEEYVKPE